MLFSSGVGGAGTGTGSGTRTVESGGVVTVDGDEKYGNRNGERDRYRARDATREEIETETGTANILGNIGAPLMPVFGQTDSDDHDEILVDSGSMKESSSGYGSGV